MSIDGKLEINSDLFTAIKWKVYRVIIGGNGVGMGISDGVERIIIFAHKLEILSVWWRLTRKSIIVKDVFKNWSKSQEKSEARAYWIKGGGEVCALCTHIRLEWMKWRIYFAGELVQFGQNFYFGE